MCSTIIIKTIIKIKIRIIFYKLYIMKIYILRHEDRTQDCSFFSPLTKKGLENSINLIDSLEKCNINVIYSSPFIRTLQTVYPYAKDKNIKINLEYGLSEIHHEDLIPKKAIGMYLPEYIAELFNYNSEYKTLMKPTEFTFPEKEINVERRTKRILRTILNNYMNTDANILIVTHQIVCMTLLKIINSDIQNYEKGHLTKIIDDNGWNLESINY
jgi:2,3-bisphosphoglycerate-dependent phosphoglycerate mutase